MHLKADLDGDEWVLNGQKIWTSRGMEGTAIFLLARTDNTVAKHRAWALYNEAVASLGA